MATDVNVKLDGYKPIKENGANTDNKLVKHLLKNEKYLGGTVNGELTANEIRKFLTVNVMGGEEGSTSNSIFANEEKFDKWKEANGATHKDFKYEDLQELAKVINLESNSEKISSDTSNINAIKEGVGIAKDNGFANFLITNEFKQSSVGAEDISTYIKKNLVTSNTATGRGQTFSYTSDNISKSDFESWQSSTTSWFNFSKDDSYKQAVKDLSYEDFQKFMSSFKPNEIIPGTDNWEKIPGYNEVA